MGFSHELGFGVIYSNIVKKDYPFNYSEMQIYGDTAGVVNEEYIRQHLINYDVFSVRRFTLLYGMNLKIPLTKFLFLNYGVRYTLNRFPFISKRHVPRYTSDFLFSSGTVDNSISFERAKNLFNFSIGLTYVL
jgi:hypothetical protein